MMTTMRRVRGENRSMNENSKNDGSEIDGSEYLLNNMFIRINITAIMIIYVHDTQRDGD